MGSGDVYKRQNQYLNEQRLNYVVTLLEYTDMPITDICLEAGFQSQRTFNRAFQEKFRKTPREYKNEFKAHEVIYQMDEEESEESDKCRVHSK